jgi:hypothetical protein
MNPEAPHITTGTNGPLLNVSNAHLLDRITALRARIGDGLNDHELTRLLREANLPREAGFSFLSFSDGFVTLSVPPQELSKWYPEQGWIVPSQEQRARAIAKKYGLTLYEPVDSVTKVWHNLQGHEAQEARHHLELSLERMTVLVAHPYYLKIRQACSSPRLPYSGEVATLVTLGPDILEDLATLYQP